MNNKIINVTKSSLPSYEEYCNEIKEIWDSHWLTNMGVKHQALEKELASYLEIPNVLLHTNGHLALENAIAAFEFPKGSEIITTPYTFASTTHAIVRNDLIPVFCDINENDYTIDTTKIENLITNKTVAILPVHVYGNICDVKEIDKIAKKHKLKVIYDAAHAFGVKYKGISVANFGDISMFSFHATKVFNTIEGGALCFKDNSLVNKINFMKNFGINGPESVLYVGGNAKMNEFQAAMGLCNLRHINEEIEKRKNVFELYNSLLGENSAIIYPKVKEDTVPNYAYYPVIFKDSGILRDSVYEGLKDNGIVARKYFYPTTPEFDCYYSKYFNSSNIENAIRISKTVLTLPMYSDLGREDIIRICEVINKMV